LHILFHLKLTPFHVFLYLENLSAVMVLKTIPLWSQGKGQFMNLHKNRSNAYTHPIMKLGEGVVYLHLWELCKLKEAKNFFSLDRGQSHYDRVDIIKNNWFHISTQRRSTLTM